MKQRPKGSLKFWITRLVEACGGQEVVSQLVGKSQSQVQRYTDPLHPKAEPTLSQVLMLEAVCRQPLVSGYIALQSQHMVVPLAIDPAMPLPAEMARFGERAAQLFSRYAAAMGDGSLSQCEAAELDAELDRVMGALAAMKPDLRAIMKGDKSHG